LDNVFTTLWGLIAFAGFVTALLIPKTEEYRSRFQDSVQDADRLVAARWSAAVRTVPVAVMAGVLIIVAATVATAGWGTQILTRMNFWLLVVSVLAQAGFAFTVRYLVARVKPAFPRMDPIAGADRTDLRSQGGGVKVSVRFDNDTDQDLMLDWINFHGSPDQELRRVVARGERTRRATYAGHLWQVATTSGRVVAIFSAPGEPAVAAVTSPMIRASPQSPDPGTS
jgi:hypothetical protein